MWLLQWQTSQNQIERGCGTISVQTLPDRNKNWEIVEHELNRQCTIGCFGRLTLEEFKERKWAFPAIGTPKKNGTFCLVIDFRWINVNLIRREFPLMTTEEILTSIKGFLYSLSIDLNMGYPLIPLNNKAKKILTISQLLCPLAPMST